MTKAYLGKRGGTVDSPVESRDGGGVYHGVVVVTCELSEPLGRRRYFDLVAAL